MSHEHHEHGDQEHRSPASPHGTAAPAIDPVCGMKVDPHSAAGMHEHGGARYYFCSTHCLERFRADPAKYLEKSVTIDPVCGMKVDPKSAAGAHEHHGVKYYFCSSHCLERFRSDPAKYLEKPAP